MLLNLCRKSNSPTTLGVLCLCPAMMDTYAIITLLVVVGAHVLAAQKETVSVIRTGGRHQHGFPVTSITSVTQQPDSPFKGLHFFHHQPSIIPVGNDPILDMHIQNKIAENLSNDPNGWETVPRLPDHDIMVGGPEHRPSTPVIHVQQHTSGGGATGVQDVMIDLAARPGGAIIQTFFGERSPEMDDDDREDFDDKYDLDDDDEKRGRDNDNDDDRDDNDAKLNEVDDVKEDLKSHLRSKLAPFIVVRPPPADAYQHFHSIPYRRSAALLHHPVVGKHRQIPTTKAPTAPPDTTSIKPRTAARSSGVVERLMVPPSMRTPTSRGDLNFHKENYRVVVPRTFSHTLRYGGGGGGGQSPAQRPRIMRILYH